MDDQRVGRVLRALRHRLGWRQTDVGAAAKISQDAVSRIERGFIDAMPLRSVRRVAASLGADLVVSIRWRGGEIDRLMDEGHAALVGAVAAVLAASGWEIQPEVSFAECRESGSIDILAWHAGSRTLLVVEVKTELTSLEETLRRHDAKVRLAPAIAGNRFGWRAAATSRLLVLPDLSTPRRRVRRHASVLDRAYPTRGPAMSGWIKSPVGSVAGMLFVSPTHSGRGIQPSVSRRRIRRTGSRPGLTARPARDHSLTPSTRT